MGILKETDTDKLTADMAESVDRHTAGSSPGSAADPADPGSREVPVDPAVRADAEDGGNGTDGGGNAVSGAPVASDRPVAGRHNHTGSGKGKTDTKASRKAGLVVVIGLAVLLLITAVLLFRPRKNVYTETHAVSEVVESAAGAGSSGLTRTPAMPTKPAAVDSSVTGTSPSPAETGNAYLTVKVPGFSGEDVRKKEQEEADFAEEAQSSGTTAEELEAVPRTRQSSPDPSGPSGVPSVVDHYYADSSTGARTVTPVPGSSDTVYVLEYDRGTAMTQETAQKIIQDYLADSSTYVTNTVPQTVHTGVSSDTGNPDSVDVSTGTGLPSEEGGMSVETGAVAEAPGSIVESSTGLEELSVENRLTQEGAMVKPALSWIIGSDLPGDGIVRCGTIGLPPSSITQLHWQVQEVSGHGYLSDTDDPFEKSVSLDEGAFIRVVVTAEYTDGFSRTSDVLDIVHDAYGM